MDATTKMMRKALRTVYSGLFAELTSNELKRESIPRDAGERPSQMDATTKMMRKALRTGRIDDVMPPMMARSRRRRPKSRSTRKARRTWSSKAMGGGGGEPVDDTRHRFRNSTL